MGLYQVGMTYGQALYRAGKQKEGIAVLRKSYEIGKQANFPDVGELEKILSQIEGKHK